MVIMVRSDRHIAVDDSELDRIESEIGDMILRLGLQARPHDIFK